MLAAKNTQSVSTLLYESRDIAVGVFHLQADHADFNSAGPIDTPTMVFPITPTIIKQENRQKFLSQPNCVNFYDGQRSYSREAKDERGDVCHWLEFSPGLIAQALSTDIAPLDADAINLDFDHLNCDSKTYRKQWQFITLLQQGKLNAEAAEEVALQLLDETLQRGFGNNKYTQMQHKKQRHNYHDITLLAQEEIINHLFDHLTVDTLAHKIGVSPFHLCRIFKLIHGWSIHQFQNHIKVKYAMEQLGHTRDIARLAVDLGFSSHSHFSTVFARLTGITPTRFRAGARY